MKVSWPVLHSVTLKEDEKVVPFTGITTERFRPDRVLMGAFGKLDDVMVIGWDHEGGLYFSCSNPDGPEALWLLRVVEKELLAISDEASEGWGG